MMQGWMLALQRVGEASIRGRLRGCRCSKSGRANRAVARAGERTRTRAREAFTTTREEKVQALRWAMRGDVPRGGDRRADNAHHDGEQRVELEGTHLLDTMLQIEEDGSSISINKFLYV
jgi:hypothetical protein